MILSSHATIIMSRTHDNAYKHDKNQLTETILTPKFLKLLIMGDLAGSETVASRTRAYVGFPALALASTMNFPM